MLKSVYLIHGPEYGLALDRFAQLREALAAEWGDEPEVLRFAGPSAWVEAEPYLWQTGWGTGRVVLLEETPLLGTKPGAGLVPDFLKQLKTCPPGNVLLLWAPGQQVSANLAKGIAALGEVWLTAPASEAERLAYLKSRAALAGRELPGEVARALVRRGLGDLAGLGTDLDKIIAYAGDEPLTVKSVEILVPEKTEERIFALGEAIGRGREGEALRLVQGLLAQGEIPLVLTSLIGRQVRLLWKLLALGSRSPEELRQELGVPAFALSSLRQQAAGFTAAALEKGWEELLQADRRLKRGRPPGPTLELLICHLVDLARAGR